MVSEKIGIIGGSGFIGSNLQQHFGEIAKVVPRLDRNRFRHQYDILINANGNSNKRLPETQPLQDFDLSVHNTLKYLIEYNPNLYIHISSCEVYTGDTYENSELDVAKMSRYGFSKYLSECLVRNYCKKCLILRLNGPIGPGLKKGAIYDILHGKRLWVSAESRFQLLHTKYICKFIDTLLSNGVTNEIFNLTGPDSVSLNDVIALHKPVEYPENPIINHNFNVEKANKLMNLPSSIESVRLL